MTSQVEVGISRRPPLAPNVFFTKMALSIPSNWSIRLVFGWILLKASCDKYKDTLENASEDGSDGTRSLAE